MGIDIQTINSANPINNGRANILTPRQVDDTLQVSNNTVTTDQLVSINAHRFDETQALPWTPAVDPPVTWFNQNSFIINSAVVFQPTTVQTTFTRTNAAGLGNLLPGDNSFSIAGWYNSVFISSTTRTIASIYNDATNNRSWRLRFLDDRTVNFLLSSDGTNLTQLTSTKAVNDNVWHFIAATYNATTDVSSLYVFRASDNNSSVVTGSHASGCFNSNANLVWGSTSNGGGARLDGRLDSWGFWYQKELSSSEVSQLYNNGAGLPNTSFDSNLSANLESFWSFNAITNLKVLDIHSDKDLTDTGAIATTTDLGHIDYPAFDNDNISNWTNSGVWPFNSAMLQLTPAATPVYNTAIFNNEPGVTFSSGNSTYLMGESVCINSVAASVAVYFKPYNDITTPQCICSSISGIWPGYYLGIDNGYLKAGYQGDYGLHYKNYDVLSPSGSLGVVMNVDDNGEISLYSTNSTLKAITPVSTVGAASGLGQSINSMYIGASNIGNSEYYNGEIAEILFDNREYQPHFVSRVLQYFNRRYT